MKNQIINERFNSTVRDIEIIRNFLPTPDWVASLPSTEIDLSFIKTNIITSDFRSNVKKKHYGFYLC